MSRKELERALDLALAEARHAWDYERPAFREARRRACEAQARLDVLDMMEQYPKTRTASKAQQEEAVQVLAADLRKHGFARYAP